MKSKLLASVLFYSGVFFVTASVAQTIPTASFSASSNTICAESSVQITDLSGNTPTAWSYSVNGVATSTAQSPELTFTASGTYSIDLEASNGSGTSAIYTETVLVKPLPVLTVSGNTQVCTAAASTLSVSGADTYTWDSGSNATMITINPAANTIYTVTGTSTLTGCSDSSFVSIFTIPLPTISVSNNATICVGQSYTINPSGASSYSYSGGSGIVSPTLNTIYTVTGTDAFTGCSDSVIVAISVNMVSITVNSGSVCNGQNFTITASGATTYSYSGGSNVVSPAVNTTYTVSGTDAVTGCTNSAAVLVAVIPSPTITVNTGSVCAGSVFTIVPSGASSYSFSGGSNTVAPLTGTTYVVSGTDLSTGCTGSTTFSLSVNPLPTITVNSGTICAGDIFTIVAIGASTYTFSSGASTVMPMSNTSYSVTGTSAEGCASPNAVVSSVVISGVKPVVTISTAGSPIICSGESVILTASGASTYSWSNGAATATVLISPTVTTIFNVAGMDALSGCASGASLLQYVSDCTGIETSAAAIQFNIYPNPTHGELTVEAGEEMTVNVISALGKVVLKQQLGAGKNTISLGEQPNGVYFVNLKHNTETKTIRVIKH